MNEEKIKRANDPKLIRAAIDFHLAESDRCYHEGSFEESRRNRYIVSSLREQLRVAGFLDPTQSTIKSAQEQLRSIDIPDAVVRINPTDLIRND
jgi:hypothetical protein